jgi:hypothetical protein
MREIDWDDVDEIPEGRECDWCGFVQCACDEFDDAHEVELDLMDRED